MFPFCKAASAACDAGSSQVTMGDTLLLLCRPPAPCVVRIPFFSPFPSILDLFDWYWFMLPCFLPGTATGTAAIKTKHHDPLTRGPLLFLALSAHGLCISSLCLFIPLQPDSVLTIPFCLDLWRLLACVKLSGLVFILILLNLQQRSACLDFQFFWPSHMACGILVPQPGIKSMSPALEAQNPNHWTPGKSQHSFTEVPSSLDPPAPHTLAFLPSMAALSQSPWTTGLETQACFSSSSALSTGNLSPSRDLNYCSSVPGTPALSSLLSCRHVYTTAF